MKKFINITLSTIILISLWGCPNGINNKHKYTRAFFPYSAVNLNVVNSEYDDYNSVLPETHFGKRLIFSSNRQSGGDNFNIIGDNFHATWFWDDGTLIVDNSTYWMNIDFISTMLSAVNKNGNQFGPYLITDDTIINDTIRFLNFFTFSTNADSNLYHQEFYFNLSSDYNTYGDNTGPFSIKFLPQTEKQRYVSFFGAEIYSIDTRNHNMRLFTDIYFDEMNNGSYDIMSIHKPDTLDFEGFLKSDGDYSMLNQEILNSPADDRCPFVNGNFIVFTSNRAGGYGGYDLYYSFYFDGSWQEPINFGPSINSEYDEFRPVAVQVMEFNNDMMIFSSNRPGGKGGFDLYYTGINKISPFVYYIE